MQSFPNEIKQTEEDSFQQFKWNINQILNRQTFVGSIVVDQKKNEVTAPNINQSHINKGSMTSRDVTTIDHSLISQLRAAPRILDQSKIIIKPKKVKQHANEMILTQNHQEQFYDNNYISKISSQVQSTPQNTSLNKTKLVSEKMLLEKKKEWKKQKHELEQNISKLKQKIILLEIKCERLETIINEVQVKGTSQQQVEQSLRDTIEKMDSQMIKIQEIAQQEFKQKDKLLIKMHDERQKNIEKVKQYKERIESKDHEITFQIQQQQQFIEKIKELEQHINDWQSRAENRNVYIQDLKNQLVKVTESDHQKTEKIQELSTKLQDLERAIRAGKFSKQNLDPIHFQVSLEGFMFKLFNDDPYAISNNIRLGLQLQNKNIFQTLSGLESKVLKENMIQDTSSDGAGDKFGKFQIIDINSVNLGKYIYAKPKFALLIENYSNSKQQLIFDPPYEQWLYMTIRGIFDSKYFELLINEDALSQYRSSRFVDFVYSWLGNFCVDKTSKMVRALEFYEKDRADNFRLQLVLGLQASQNINENLWEYNAFVEFLEEKLSTDEMCYYLHCRNLLFNGPHLKDTGSHQRMHLIDLDQAYEFVDYLFEKMPSEDVIKLKARLKSLSRRAPMFKNDDEEIDLQDLLAGNEKSQKQLLDYWQIDQGLLLRILLEYYRREKKIRILLLKRLIDEEPVGESINLKGNIMFASYKKIMDSFDPSMTEIEVSRTYREAFVAGNGCVNYDSIVLVLNEQNFFVRTLQIKGRNHSPIVNQQNDIAVPEDLDEEQTVLIGEERIRDTQISTFIYEHWRNNESNLLSIKRLIENSGQENLLNMFSQLENYIKNKGQIDPAKVRGKTMLQIYRRLWMNVIRFRISFLEWNQDDFSIFTANSNKTIQEVDRELSLFSTLIDDENGMMFEFQRQPKGKEVSEAKRSWQHMQNLLAHGYFMSKDTVALKHGKTTASGSQRQR